MKWDVTFTDFQSDFLHSRARFPAMVAAWGTGKTMTALAKGMALSIKYPNNKGLVLRKEMTNLSKSTMSDFEFYTQLKIPVQSKTIVLPNGSTIIFSHADELSGVVQNINLGWFFIEQAEEFDNDEVFNLLDGRLRRKGCFCQGFIIANANGHNWIWRKWINKGSVEYLCDKEFDIEDEGERYGGYADVVQATTFDNAENLKPSFIEALKIKKETSPSHYRRFVMNSHEDVDTADKVFPYQKLLDAVDRDLRDYDDNAIVISCDPAEFGDDKTVIYVLKGLEVISSEIYGKKSLMETAGYIMKLHYQHHAEIIAIDDIGVGAGVRSRLKELNAPVMGINSGSRATDPILYTRLRDQMWMHASQLFKDDYVSIPNDENLIEDLAAFTYGMNSKGQMLIARKRDVKKLIARSPDRGDALVMGLWCASNTKKKLPVLLGKMSAASGYDPLEWGL